MKSCLRQFRALCARFSRLPILVLLLSVGAAYADASTLPESNNESVTYTVQDRAASPTTQNSRSDPVSPAMGGGAVSYWLLAFLLAANIAGVIYMRRWAAMIESREDKE